MRRDMWDRHERSRRFVRTAFKWEENPSDELLMEAADQLCITLTLSADQPATLSDHLIVLAAANMILRLPFKTEFAVRRSDSLGGPWPPPFKGQTLEEAIAKLGRRLNVPANVTQAPERGGTSLLVNGADGLDRFFLGASGWHAYLRPIPVLVNKPGNALSAYAVAAMGVAETIRTWARSAKALGVLPGQQFDRATKPSSEATINLWRPGTTADGPRLDGLTMPAIDWVGGGAVTQAALSSLIAIPGLGLCGRVFDPKSIDEPDLNRSILSFVENIDEAKPMAIRSSLRNLAELQFISERFPSDRLQVAPWIVCGADDVSIRPTCQQLWPERLFVVSTEDQFAQVSSHTPEDGHFCAGCFSDGPSAKGPAPTIVSTSVMSGVIGAATLAKAAIADTVPARTNILTMRLDSPIALEEVKPLPNPKCPTCRNRRLAT